PSLPAVLGLSLLGISCATQSTSIHGGYSLAVTGTVFDDYETSVAGTDVSTGLSDIGLRVEAFTSPSASFFAELKFREYDMKGPASADGNELHLGGRYYFLPDQPLQPFVQGGFYYGDALEFTGGVDSGGYAGLGVGGGAAFYFAQSALVEAGLRYDTSLLHPEITVAGTDIEYELAGWSGWIGLGISF
nr:hypothetical protein [Planctomycetota bacterium]